MNTQSNNWELPWVELEQHGNNVGIEHVINPVLYPAIIHATHTNTLPFHIYDFGSGTSSIAFDLLVRNAKHIPGFRGVQLHEVNQFRKQCSGYTGYEQSELLTQKARKRFTAYGLKGMHAMVCDAADPLRAISTNKQSQHPKMTKPSQTLAVSRNLVMHLSTPALHHHLAAVAFLVGTKGYYILSTLHPEYERTKAGSTLRENQEYVYRHGANGELGTFTHYFRSQKALERILCEHFVIENREECAPPTKKFIKTHPRYYKSPLALVYVLRPSPTMP